MADTFADERAFNAMFTAHHEAIQRYCYRRLPRADVNDAVADVFLVAWRRIRSAPLDDQLPWLYGVSRNVVRNVQRTSRRRIALRARLNFMGADGATEEPEVLVVRGYETQTLLDALDRLSTAEQELLRLKTWEELSNGEIALTLGTTTRAIEMRLNRARKRLQKEHESISANHSEQKHPRFIEEGGGQ